MDQLHPGQAQVDLWSFPLEESAPENLLNAAERLRSRQYLSAIASKRFIAARTALRRILGLYCGIGSLAVPIRETVLGKPYLAGRFAHIRFSLSHSQNLALVAVSTNARVGVDVESRRRGAKRRPAVSYWLHEEERHDLNLLKRSDRAKAFLNLWCRKEAVIKAEGSGLGFGLERFRVSVSPASPAVLSWPTSSMPWHLLDVPLFDEFEAALAVDKPVTFICIRELS